MATSRARKGLLAALAVGLGGGCGAEARVAQPVPATKTQAPEPSASAAAVVVPLPTFEAMAAKQVRVAPGMRELARGDSAGAVTLPGATRDVCVRIAYASSDAVTAALVSHDGAVLATSAAAREGVLDARGPICFHPSDQPRLTFGTDAGVVRYVVWGAP